MESIEVLKLVLRWAHLVAAMAAIGGAMFSWAALVPAMARTLTADVRAEMREAVRRRWARVVHLSIAVLLLTGLINFYLLAIQGDVKPMPYHGIFGVKVLAALVIFVLASLLLGRAPGFAKLRERSGRWFGVIVILGLVIILLSGLLLQVRTAG